MSRCSGTDADRQYRENHPGKGHAQERNLGRHAATQDFLDSLREISARHCHSQRSDAVMRIANESRKIQQVSRIVTGIMTTFQNR
jgi:hypothetical protein